MPTKAAKTGIVIPYRFVPPRNGGHHAAFGFCEALAKKQEVVVISTTNNATDEVPFRLVKLFADRFFKYFSPVVAWRLWQFFRREGIRSCIIQQPFFGLVALPVCRWLKIEFVVYSHNIEFQRFKTIGKWWWRLLYPLERLMYRNADRMLFISPDDREAAIPIFGLSPKKCAVVPYGTRLREIPTDRSKARQEVISAHRLNSGEYILLFFGPQSYRPNLEAVERIVYQINPLLQQRANFPYRILICGGGLPPHLNELKSFQNVEYLGFVENIERYIKAADMVLNPITTGGGVKTKIIEAIALGTTVLSSATGAKGIDTSVFGSKLLTVPDENSEAFVQTILEFQAQAFEPTPASFYEMYNWDEVIKHIK